MTVLVKEDRVITAHATWTGKIMINVLGLDFLSESSFNSKESAQKYIDDWNADLVKKHPHLAASLD